MSLLDWVVNCVWLDSGSCGDMCSFSIVVVVGWLVCIIIGWVFGIVLVGMFSWVLKLLLVLIISGCVLSMLLLCSRLIFCFGMKL